MGKIFKKITAPLKTWVAQQKLFFVSTAPLSQEGLVNCSPKGMDSFRILDEHTVAYIDLIGSGVETIAHLKENQRITIMFCAFDGPPKILRFYGKGAAYIKDSAAYEELKHLFPEYINARAIIKINVHRIADSCGYAVPKYEFKEDRQVLSDWAKRKSKEELVAYVKEKNAESLDGLEGI